MQYFRVIMRQNRMQWNKSLQQRLIGLSFQGAMNFGEMGQYIVDILSDMILAIMRDKINIKIQSTISAQIFKYFISWFLVLSLMPQNQLIQPCVFLTQYLMGKKTSSMAIIRGFSHKQLIDGYRCNAAVVENLKSHKNPFCSIIL